MKSFLPRGRTFGGSGWVWEHLLRPPGKPWDSLERPLDTSWERGEGLVQDKLMKKMCFRCIWCSSFIFHQFSINFEGLLGRKISIFVVKTCQREACFFRHADLQNSMKFTYPNALVHFSDLFNFSPRIFKNYVTNGYEEKRRSETQKITKNTSKSRSLASKLRLGGVPRRLKSVSRRLGKAQGVFKGKARQSKTNQSDARQAKVRPGRVGLPGAVCRAEEEGFTPLERGSPRWKTSPFALR